MKVRTFRSVAGGGSSLLVVFLMVFLVTLGAFAMVSSESNLRLARKGVSWVTESYMLEAGGEALLDIISENLARVPTLTRVEGGEGRHSTLTRMLRDGLEQYIADTGKALPFGVIIGKVGVESDSSNSVTITAHLLKEHQSTTRCLLIEARYDLGTVGPEPYTFRILKWKHYQELFEYETELGRW